MIGIIDYGMGNLFSVQKAIHKAGEKTIICSRPEDVNLVDIVVLPGVGHFKAGMYQLKARGFYDVIIEEVVNNSKPVIGICLGMQLLTKFSEEGMTEGLGLINASTKKFLFRQNTEYRIPHMGWNTVKPAAHLPQDSWHDFVNKEFFFVHSYYVECDLTENVLFTSNYGIEFASGIIKDSVVGTQFHPEKSHDQGISLIKHLIELFNV